MMPHENFVPGNIVEAFHPPILATPSPSFRQLAASEPHGPAFTRVPATVALSPPLPASRACSLPAATKWALEVAKHVPPPFVDSTLGQRLPHSVKGAPQHLRPFIRKKQNSESAKRSRQRKKEAANEFYARFEEQCRNMLRLEKRVAQLSHLIAQKQKEEDEEDEPADGEGVEGGGSERLNDVAGKAEASSLEDHSGSNEDMSTDVEPSSSAAALVLQEDLKALLDECMQEQCCPNCNCD